jgi:HEAT repeat
MRYEKINPLSRQEAETIFKQRDAEAMSDALLSVTFHGEDWHWVQSSCLMFLEDPDTKVRAVAATCLGHLARIHGIIDVATVVPALEPHLSDPEVGGRASDALDDIAMFVKNVSP